MTPAEAEAKAREIVEVLVGPRWSAADVQLVTTALLAAQREERERCAKKADDLAEALDELATGYESKSDMQTDMIHGMLTDQSCAFRNFAAAIRADGGEGR